MKNYQINDFEIEIAVKAANQASYYMESERPQKIDSKSHEADLVTELDRKIERVVREILKSTGHQILGEEMGGSKSLDERTWVIDPIDGTLNYITGSKLYGFNLALMENSEVIMGLTYLPALYEKYFAIKGEGLYYNDKKLDKLNVDRESYLPLVVNERDRLSGSFHPTRNLGAASVELAWTARGVHQVTAYEKVAPWDVAPGILFNLEMGNIALPRKNNDSIYWDSLIVGSPEHVKHFLD